jgi:hypothetical protein
MNEEDSHERHHTCAAAALLLGLSSDTQVNAADPRPPKVGLNVREIQCAETPDAWTIIFRMRGGKVWRNALRPPVRC